MIYDRPVSELMQEAASALTPPFTRQAFVDWFAQNYPKIKPKTVTAHVRGLTANSPSRRYHPLLAAMPPLFFQTGRGIWRRFEPDTDIGEEPEPDEPDVDGEDPDERVAAQEAAEFVLEGELESFLATNWSRLDWGRSLQVWRSADGRSGHQLNTPVGRLDFLCVDVSSNALVVLELKRGRPSDRVVGQIARYMGWVRANLASNRQPVEGLIVAHESDEALQYAVGEIPGLQLMTYDIRFELRNASPG